MSELDEVLKTPRNPNLDPERARRAAQDPRRTTRCEEGARVAPLVNRARCEGKADCVAVCPYGVFEVRTLTDGEYRALPPLARLKAWVHGKKTADTPNADACRACGLCVVACPEKALTLAPRVDGREHR